MHNSINFAMNMNIVTWSGSRTGNKLKNSCVAVTVLIFVFNDEQSDVDQTESYGSLITSIAK